MKTNCATSSRRVMFFIQRRTAAEVLRGAAGFAGVVASTTQAASRNAPYFSLAERMDTLTVCQIHLAARFGEAALPYRPGGFRGVARLMRRFTQLNRCTGSWKLLAITTSAPV